jgi:hypothetical protein
MGKSNTPEFGAGGSTFNEVFGRTRNPWNTSLTSGGSTGGGAVSVATGEVWLAQGTDHGGSLRGPGSHCSVVGLRPSPGRVTRGTVNNLWSPLSVQGPMARSVADLALFLDAMAGFCPLDPLTFDALAVSFSAGLARPAVPKRVAFTADYNGRTPIDSEVREICRSNFRRGKPRQPVVGRCQHDRLGFGELCYDLSEARAHRKPGARDMALDIAPAGIEIDDHRAGVDQSLAQRRWLDHRGGEALQSQHSWAMGTADPIAIGGVSGQHGDIVPPHLLQP